MENDKGLEPSFFRDLKELIRIMADPVTPHTVNEIWCRFGPDCFSECLPTFLSILKSPVAAEVSLVLNIFEMQAERISKGLSTKAKVAVVNCLDHEERYVVSAAISCLGALGRSADLAVDRLREILVANDALLSTRAASALIDVEAQAAEDVFALLIQRLDVSQPLLASYASEASEALAKLGSRAEAAVPALRPLLLDSLTREPAAMAIFKIVGDIEPLETLVADRCQSSDFVERMAGYELSGEVAELLRGQNALHDDYS